MHMTIDYVPETNGTGTAGVPEMLHVKMIGHDGPEFAALTWDRTEPENINGNVYRIRADARVNGTPGMAAFVMQGAKLLYAFSENGAVSIQSIRISQKPGFDGFELAGTPLVSACVPRGSVDIRQYFNRNRLFVNACTHNGGLHAVWFDMDVSEKTLETFLAAHRKPCQGTFARALRPGSGWQLAYLYADPDMKNQDLRTWLSEDRYTE